MDAMQVLLDLEAKLKRGEVTKAQAKAYLQALQGKTDKPQPQKVMSRIQVHYTCDLCGHEAVTHQVVLSTVQHLVPTTIRRKTCGQCITSLTRYDKETIIKGLMAVLNYGEDILPDSGLSPFHEHPETDWEQVLRDAGCPVGLKPSK